MENLNKYIEIANAFTKKYEEYTVKNTKVASKAMRLMLNDMKKLATLAKADLMEADKK